MTTKPTHKYEVGFETTGYKQHRVDTDSREEADEIARGALNCNDSVTVIIKKIRKLQEEK